MSDTQRFSARKVKSELMKLWEDVEWADSVLPDQFELKLISEVAFGRPYVRLGVELPDVAADELYGSDWLELVEMFEGQGFTVQVVKSYYYLKADVSSGARHLLLMAPERSSVNQFTPAGPMTFDEFIGAAK